MKIVFATANPHKVEEVNSICAGSKIEFILPPEGFNPIENGETFEENSLIKAKEAYRLSKMMTLADDSGLCVDALDGAPGVFSARYASTQQGKISKLLNELDNVQERSAKFVCAMTLLDENGEIVFQTRGECLGEIINSVKGANGFGYDPVFRVKGTTLTMAEMSEDAKNKISHRFNALKKVLEFLD